ncbi:iron-sulfur cluster carrier protein ApbC [Pseudoalteromonas sp. T1lg65]|uniref:iron-sulfur cluster carrier protein ApbC n=1 Tax=Pseudoalteromonas sp. T1lg65 TaxID=2077101 RepID=UPI003F7A036A
MFGLEKLFTRGKSSKQRVIELLSRYRSTAFPVGIEANWVTSIEEKDGGVVVSINFPFAVDCNSPLQTYLQKELACNVEINSQVIVVGKPAFKSIKHIILVASGKGGVGKSTTALNLAYGLASQGGKVGILDADIYGPSMPSLLGLENQKPNTTDNKTLEPLQKNGIKVMSIGFLVDQNDATVWRGPMASQALTQLLNETNWGELDYLIVDMPPGTGDIQLTMTQKVPATGAIVVTTPQTLALADAQKGIAMFEKVQLPLLGLVENMSFFNCEHCGERNYVFGQDGGAKLASRYGAPLLAEIPLNSEIRRCSEKAQNILSYEENAPSESAMAQHYVACSQLVASMIYYQSNHHSSVEIVVTQD